MEGERATTKEQKEIDWCLGIEIERTVKMAGQSILHTHVLIRGIGVQNLSNNALSVLRGTH